MSRLTAKRKAEIDAMSDEDLLRGNRFAPVGDPRFQGKAGEYWLEVMLEKKKSCDHVAVSKKVGWG